MQQSDQARPALVLDAALLLDPGADLARRSRQRLGDPGCQLALLRFAQATGAAFVAEACQALDPVFLIQPIPGADRIVVQQQDFRDGFAAHAVVQQHQRVRPPRQAMRRRTVPSQFGQVLARFAVQEAAADHANGRIRVAAFGKGVFGFWVSSGYSVGPCPKPAVGRIADPRACLAQGQPRADWPLTYINGSLQSSA